MNARRRCVFFLLIMLSVVTPLLSAQGKASKASATAEVPAQMKFSGTLKDSTGKARIGTAGVLFAIYSEQKGGSPLWQDVVNVQLDEQGRFTVLLGANEKGGMPTGIFTTNEARWLGLQVLADSEPEQGRVLLVSVPYALKAKDAETLGGRPAKDYLLASTNRLSTSIAQAAPPDPEPAAAVNTAGGTTNSIPKFSTASDLVDSIITEKLVGVDLRVGIGTGVANPVSKLEVAGDVTLSGKMFAPGFEISAPSADGVYILNTHPDGNGMEVNVVGTGFAYGFFATSESFNGSGAIGLAFPPPSGSPIAGDYSYGMAGVNFNGQGSGMFAWSGLVDGGGLTGLPIVSDTAGIYAGVASTTGIPAVLDHRGPTGGTILSARLSGVEKISMNTAGNITASGTVTANAFSGDGSALTNVTGVGSLASDPAACSANNFVTDMAANGTLTCAQPSSSNLSDGASLATKTYADNGDAAVAAPQYVTLASSSTLPNERVLTAGKGIAITDGGAGSAVTIDNKAEFAQTSIQSGDTITASPASFATTYTIPANTLTVGSVIEVWSAGHFTNGGTLTQFSAGVKLNSTEVVPTPFGPSISPNFSNMPWNMTARIICTSVVGTSATLEAQGLMTAQFENPSASNKFNPGALRPLGNLSTITVDPTITQVLSIHSSVPGGFNDAADAATMRQLIVKILK